MMNWNLSVERAARSKDRAPMRTALAMAVLLLAASFAPAQEVAVWMSSEDGAHQLSPGEPLTFEETPHARAAAIQIDLNETYQSMLGMGASFEHATCYNLSKLPKAKRDEVIARLVDPQTGIGMNLMRLCIGTSDFAPLPYYTYDDMPEGETDPKLEHFSIAKDREYVLPVIKTALEKNPDLLFFASPWSPPAWMKTKHQLGGGAIDPDHFPAYARYLLRYLGAYADEGVPIHAMTVQNEPHMVHPEYPTCYWQGEEQRDFFRDHLGPLFREHDVATELWCWDHNWNNIEFPRTILRDDEAAQHVDGVAFHLYEGRVEAQSELHEEFPQTPIYFTEGSTFRTWGACKTINILRHWARSYNAWVILLDEARKPNSGPHSASATCIELQDDLSVEYRFDYYMYGQFMKYIQRGAVRVASGPVERRFAHVAFRNPDGSVVLVVANASRSEEAFGVANGRRVFTTRLPGRSVATYRWMP